MVYLFNLVRLIRVKHYIKNLLIFLPLVFAGKMLELDILWNTIIGFLIFSITASIVYIVNDIRDVEKDRQHHVKCNRPIASGVILEKHAIWVAIILGIFVLVIHSIFISSLSTWILLTSYFVINILYTYGLKNIPLVDISIIVAGFVMRVSYGGFISGLSVTNWMYLTIIALSFFLAIGKRRNELRRLGDTSRSVLRHYPVQFLDKMMYVSLSLSIMFYALWCISPEQQAKHSAYLIWTVPIAMIIVMRYSMIVESESDGDPAEVILGDRVLLFLGFIFGASLFTLMIWG